METGRRLAWLSLVVASGLATIGCTSAPSAPSAIATAAASGSAVSPRPNDIPQPPAGSVTLHGIGASLPAPLYKVWVDRFASTYPNVSISYDAQGSVAGIAAVVSRSASFGASDTAMTDAEIASASGAILHVPTALGAISIVVNLPDLPSVQLDGATLGAMYLGRVTSWNDAAIAALNPGVTMPDVAIAPIHRSDPSGTTNAFTAYLDASSSEWHAGPGVGRSVAWPAGTSGTGDDGVAAAVKATPGAIGYAGSAFAAAAGLRTAKLRNTAGTFLRATSLGIGAAGETSVAGLAADFRERPVVNAPGVNAYPIVVYAYVLARADQVDRASGEALVAFLAWCLTTGQVDAAPQGYAALPGGVQSRALSALHGITAAGSPIWP